MLGGLAKMIMSKKMDEAKQAEKGDKPKKRKTKYDPDKPFLLYGVGIQNYFVLQERLIKLFCLLTVISIPQMLIYSYFNGYNYRLDDTLYTRLSFGNMGQSSSNCGKNFINWDESQTRLHFQCECSTRISSIIAIGVDEMAATTDDQDSQISRLQNCHNDKDPMLNFAQVHQQIETQCFGTQVCTASIDNSLLATQFLTKNFE